MRFLRPAILFGFLPILVIFPGAKDAKGAEKTKLKSASELIARQEPGKVFPDILSHTGERPMAIVVSLSKQRAYLMVGEKAGIDTPISSGRRNGWTPKGNFKVLEKDPDHHSTLYGEFVDGSGHVVRSGVSSRLDAAPSGTSFRGAPMKYFLRLTPEGVGMHAGILPGYPASHGCIRLPPEIAKLLYSFVTVNTPVIVEE